MELQTTYRPLAPSPRFSCFSSFSVFTLPTPLSLWIVLPRAGSSSFLSHLSLSSLSLSHIHLGPSPSYPLLPQSLSFSTPSTSWDHPGIACSLSHWLPADLGRPSIHSCDCRGATHPATRKAHLDEEGCGCRGGGSIDCFSQTRRASSD